MGSRGGTEKVVSKEGGMFVYKEEELGQEEGRAEEGEEQEEGGRRQDNCPGEGTDGWQDQTYQEGEGG